MWSLLLLSLLCHIISSSTNEETLINIPTSCVGLEDGSYMMKLIDSDLYPTISVECSNEYIIIDPSHDDVWNLYFSSYAKYHYGVAGATRNDLVSWNEWFLPSLYQTSDRKSKYLISLNCDSCSEDSYLQKYEDQSTFYLSALAFGCFSPTRGWPSCDMEWPDYECRLCHWNEEQSQIIWTKRDYMTRDEADSIGELTGVCDFEIRRSDAQVLDSFADCQTYIPDANFNYKPSIGTDGRHCLCYRPEVESMIIESTVDVTKDEYNDALNRINYIEDDINDEITLTSENNIIHLSQDDFKEGTYRITESGTYIIDEDIEFDFNANWENPLANDAWWPTTEQVNEYDGAQEARGPYFLGFFAGITIETDDVVLDLNEHELRMSLAFFFTQAFFSIIELANQAFLPQQGPGFFGDTPSFGTNVIIRNGILGLSSHHGIHGNYNENLQILNIHIRNFQTHGIQLNGYTNIVIEDVEIGPTTNIAYLNGNYAHLRALLPTFRAIADEYSDEYITFNERDNIEYSMNDLLNILEPLMNSAFNYANYRASGNINEMKLIQDDDDWNEIHKLFINPSGLSYGAVTYGLFLNYPSAGIFGWHVNDAISTDAVLTNLNIHDLQRQGEEVVGLSMNGHIFANGFNGPLPAKSMFGSIENVFHFANSLYKDDDNQQLIHIPYVGDIVSDIHFAMFEFGRINFDYWPGIPYYGDEMSLLNWAKGEDPLYIASDNTHLDVYCNSDAMFHPAKGLLGIKLTGSRNVVVNNLKIENLVDLTPVGHDLCGKKDLYHFSQQDPYQIGFSMNQVHGISIDFSDVEVNGDLNIANIYSATGLTFAMSQWFDTEIVYNTGSSVNINNIYPGYDLSQQQKSTMEYTDRPNKLAEACGIRYYSSDTFQVSNIQQDTSTITIQCIGTQSDVGCFGELDEWTMIGDVTATTVEIKCQTKPQLSTANVNTIINNNSDFNFNLSSPLFYSLLCLAIILIMFVSKKIYYDYGYNKVLNSNFKYQLVNNNEEDKELYGTFS